MHPSYFHPTTLTRSAYHKGSRRFLVNSNLQHFSLSIRSHGHKIRIFRLLTVTTYFTMHVQHTWNVLGCAHPTAYLKRHKVCTLSELTFIHQLTKHNVGYCMFNESRNRSHYYPKPAVLNLFILILPYYTGKHTFTCFL